MAEAAASGSKADGPPIERRSRLANKAQRRQQLIEATIESVNQAGFAETTLAKVATLAGVSQGIVVFHFGTKDQLLIETLRFLSEEYRLVWQRELAKAGSDPVDRLCALIAADFQPEVVSRKKLTVWHAFYGEAKAHPTYLEICGARDEEHAEVLRSLCAELLAAAPATAPVQEAAMVAGLLDNLSDGLWLGMLMSKWEIGRADALSAMFQQLRVLFPAFAERFADYLSAAQSGSSTPAKRSR
jgi:TetR/AcrR family transcriptional repressor of bet genes